MNGRRDRRIVEEFRALSEFVLSDHDIAELPVRLVSGCAGSSPARPAGCS